jgi:hypothetical protein
VAGIPGWLLAQAGQDVTVEPWQGQGAYGDTWGAPVTVRAVVEATVRLVRDRDGQQVASDTALYLPLDTVAPAGSRITLASGRVTTVVAAMRNDGGALPVPSHLELAVS